MRRMQSARSRINYDKLDAEGERKIQSERGRLLGRSPGSAMSSAAQQQAGAPSPAPSLIPTKSRMGELADIVGEAAGKATVKLPLRLPTAEESLNAQRLLGLNESLEKEVLRVREKRDGLLESARRARPSDSDAASPYAALAARHLGEAVVRAWRGVTSAATETTERCASPVVGSPARGRLPGSPPRRGASPSRHSTPGKQSASNGVLSSGEAAVREAHLTRIYKRSVTMARGMARGMAKDMETERLRQQRARVLEDKADEACSARYLWCGTMTSRRVWDGAMLVLILYSCVVIPYRIGMDVVVEGAARTFSTVVTILFITDLCLNFNTAYQEGQYYIIDRSMIAANYLKGWFCIDLASSFPYEAFDTWFEALLVTYGYLEPAVSGGGDSAHSSSLKLLRALRLFRLLRLLRLLRLQQYIDSIEDQLQVNLGVLQIIKMVLGLIYLMHILGCFWFYVAINSGHEVTWLTEYDGGSGLKENGATLQVQYLYSVYWALMTLTTVGYGDITPANDTERGYALASLLIGALVFGYMLSSIGDLIASLDPHASKLQEQLDEVKEFTRWHQMSPDLASRVRKYYEFFFSRQGPGDEAELINNLAPYLKRDVQNHLLALSVCKLSFFYVPMVGSTPGASDAPCDVDWLLAVYPLLKPVVREPKETLIHKGTLGVDLIFVYKGQCHACGAYAHGRRLYSIVDQGAFITEHVLADTHSEVDYVATARCELYMLAVDELQRLVERFPHAREEIAHYVADDMLDHKKHRTWSLRLAQRERFPAGLSPAEHERELMMRGALLLQVGWMKRRLVRLEERVGAGDYESIFPCLYGKMPKLEAQAIERRKLRRAASKASAQVLPGMSQSTSVGVLPFGGAFTPRGFGQAKAPSGAAVALTAAEAPKPTRLGSAGSGASTPVTVEPLSENAVEQLRALPAFFDAVEQRMTAREQQLQAVQETLNKLLRPARADGRGAAPATMSV